ncbi:VOC family protein [Paenibacillus kobensis]|uniref:VOC family protein n=1 Tax=Paenibacillus kobensis TaxID=59841 RepID=UPI000FD707F9|nr:VOC family protein [Paenibacillus kobensis]
MKEKALLSNIYCVYMPSDDPVGTANWYIQNFGLTLPAGEPNENRAVLELPSGQWLFLFRTPDKTTANFIAVHNVDYGDNFNMFSLTFQVEHITPVYELLKSSGSVMTELDDRGSCGYSFIIEDPSGNRLAIWSDLL